MRKTPILLRRGLMSGNVVVLHRYTRQELLNDGAEHIVGILDGVADGDPITSEQRAEVRILRERLKIVVERNNARLP